MLKSLRTLLASIRTVKTPAGRNPRRFTPQVETLTDRVMPTVDVIGGHVIIHGTVGNDDVVITDYGSYYRVSEIRRDLYIPSERVTNIPVASVTGDILFKGFEGNDYFVNLTAVKSIAFGGTGNDQLQGGTGQDQLYGEDGNDYLTAGTGPASNHLDGGNGQDALYGSDGPDTLYGGFGADTVYGGAGNDLLAGNADFAPNTLDGGSGDDSIYGGLGADLIRGGPGADVLVGYAGNDVLEGGTGRDSLDGGDGDDRLDGGVGDGEADYMVGGAGRDSFRRDLVSSTSRGLYVPAYNLDRPADFDPNQDAIYI